MTGEIVFLSVLAVAAGAIIFRTIRKKTKKSCCE